MFYVFDSATNSHVFTVIDPLTDGYKGPKESDVTLDEVFDMTVREGERYPEPFLGRSKEDSKFFRVFRNRSECVASNFQPLALNWENWLWWSDRTAVANLDFSEVADEFIEKVKSKKIVGTTEVNVVYYCMDLTEHQPQPPFRMSMVANTKVRADGDPEFARQFANVMHLDSIILNINNMVRPATPERFLIPRNAPKIPMSLVRMHLEVINI